MSEIIYDNIVREIVCFAAVLELSLIFYLVHECTCNVLIFLSRMQNLYYGLAGI